jgi:hypothetical protein
MLDQPRHLWLAEISTRIERLTTEQLLVLHEHFFGPLGRPAKGRFVAAEGRDTATAADATDPLAVAA